MQAQDFPDIEITADVMRVTSGPYTGHTVRTFDYRETGGYVVTEVYDHDGNQRRDMWSSWQYDKETATKTRTKYHAALTAGQKPR